MTRRILISVLVLVGVSGYSQTLLVPPYLQPGNAPTLSKEQKVLIWQTDSIQGNFKVEYTLNPPGQKVAVAKSSFSKLFLKNKTTYLYRATLSGLKFDASYTYKVSLNGKVLAENSFTTRTLKPQTKFVVFGDCGGGTPQQAGIAYQVYQQKPEFVLVTGDNVYLKGLENEYRKNFFPYYTAKEANPAVGAPLMNSIPFYMILGNHDVYGVEFDKTQDGLAYFYYNDLPLNGPITDLVVKPTGPEELVKSFKANTKPRYPRISNYSFEHGNVHIACIDANTYTNPLDPGLVQWLAEDLRNSRADWKIVSYHHPGFNSSKAHYDYQYMRLLSPILEQLGVDLVLTGHVHNYQRTLPLTFDPKKDSTGTRYVVSPEGRVDGTFTLDQHYDGITNTKPKGIIYIVTGAGGAPLYDPSLSGKPELWKHDPQENWVPFTAKIVSDIHSFTTIETNGKKMVLKQMNAQGVAFDEIMITK
ncbi:MAG TPA: metallophosphoesterase family protein [Cyclobacteriaceae bacterium]|nr:metallophosphoesterase family protein [Cyclobacteriaceae bacterium]